MDRPVKKPNLVDEFFPDLKPEKRAKVEHTLDRDVNRIKRPFTHIPAPVDLDRWKPCDRDAEPVYTPYGKGVVSGENEAGTHFRVVFKDGKARRIIKKNCLAQPKLNQKAVRDRYETDHKTRSVTGKPYVGVLDRFRKLGSDPVVLRDICELNYIPYEKYAHLNPGMQRMCIGNVLRRRSVLGQPVIFPDDAA